MGEKADYIIDRMMDGDYHSGYAPRSVRSKRKLKCNKCGATNVYWHQYPSGKWFLFTCGTSEPHKCKEVFKQPKEK
jgi:hypothetical protein